MNYLVIFISNVHFHLTHPTPEAKARVFAELLVRLNTPVIGDISTDKRNTFAGWDKVRSRKIEEDHQRIDY